jgi:hypothetical protein
MDKYIYDWHKVSDFLPKEDLTKDKIGTGKSREVLVVLVDEDTGKKLRRVAYYDYHKSVWKQKMILKDLPFDSHVKVTHWQEIDGLPMGDFERPADRQKVKWKRDSEYEGVYIESEDLFTIGFDNEADFIFASFVESWKPLNENKVEIHHEK